MIGRKMLLCLALSSLALPLRAATIGVYFDSSGNNSSAEVAPFSIFHCFVVIEGAGDISGYEFTVSAAAPITLMNATMMPPSSLNVGPGTGNWIVGIGQCVSASSARAVLQLSGMLTSEAVNLYLDLEASRPSSVYGEGPAYATCDDQILGFDEISPAIVNLRPESFGRVKHRYGEG